MRKKLLLGFLAITMCFTLTGCLSNNTKEKTYKSNGISVTLEEDMVEKDLVSATVYYEGQKTLFMGLKETFESLSLVGLSKNSTVEEYAEAVIKNNKADYEIQKDDDLVYFTYEKESNGKKYYYLSALVKGSDAFWLTNFACNESDKDKYKSKFIKWAKTIKVD